MQHRIVNYVEQLKALVEGDGFVTSFHDAVELYLRSVDRATLLKLRDAALDLQRLTELAIQTRDDDLPAA